MNNKISLKVNTDINAYSEVLAWFEQMNQPPIKNQEIWWQCQTLLIEGFTNIVEHAHKNLPLETPIELEAVRLNEQIEIRIFAQGEPFDLEQQLAATLELENNYDSRGRGLKIMSTIADQFSYEPTKDKRYCLFMCKNYGSSVSST